MQCIVFTDSKRLAVKYRVSQQDVLSILQQNLCDNQNIKFLILDASEYPEELGHNPRYVEYKNIIADFMLGMGISPSPKLSLFIVGGDDVIPMPRIVSPINNEELLQADILYCFKDENMSCLNFYEALYNVGRLPLESGSLPSELRDDLQSYFNLSNIVLNKGISVDTVLMTSTESWLPASNDMVRGFPVTIIPKISEATNGNMYISPRLSVDDYYVIKHYKCDIGKADLLMFNLHGSDVRGYSSFYGEGLNGHNTPEAFTCDMLKDSRARIINTVACFGGRYIGYSRNDSMLLSAMYGGGVLLYAGSSSSALGRTGKIHHVAQDVLMPSGYSESFMKLYTLYLFKGISAGEAFLSAKCDYFNLCHHQDGDDRALATVLMFNLFGMPILRVNKNEDVIQEVRGIKQYKPLTKSKAYAYKRLNDISTAPPISLLEQVRFAVDSNLQFIRNFVESNLYKYWGLDPRYISRIDEIICDSIPSGYRFEYITPGSVVSKRSWAYIDKKGNVEDVVHFK